CSAASWIEPAHQPRPAGHAARVAGGCDAHRARAGADVPVAAAARVVAWPAAQPARDELRLAAADLAAGRRRPPRTARRAPAAGTLRRALGPGARPGWQPVRRRRW